MSGRRLPDDPRAEPQELRLERVGGGGSGPRRAAAAGLLIVAFLGLAIAKPWAPSTSSAQALPSDGATPSSSLAPSEPPPASTAPPVRQAAWAPVPYVPGPAEPVPSAGVRASIRPHDGWGIRAVADGPAPGAAGTGLAERWTPSNPERWVSLDAGNGPVRALGVTAPASLLIVDVRVWATIDGVDRWLDVEPVAGANPGSGILFWPPRIAGAWASEWPAGTYRFDILTAGGVGQFGVELVGPTVSLADPRPATRLWDGAGSTGFASLGPGIGPGIVLGVLPGGAAPGAAPEAPAVLGLGGRTTAGLGYGTAWLDTIAGQASPVSAFGVTAYAPTVVSIGVLAPAGLRVDGGKLVRLRPGLAQGTADPADRAVAIPTPVERGQGEVRQAIRFDQPDGRAWEPGTYAVLVDGMGPNGHDSVGYLLTLLPGSARSVAAPLAGARAWARFAGRWGIAAGLLEPLDAPGRLAIRYAATAPEVTVSGGADFSLRCLEVNLVDTALPFLGIGHPTGIRPGAVEVQRVFLDGSVALARPASALSVLPGLTMVSPPEGSGWAPGWYRLVVYMDVERVALPVCVGSAGPGYLAVPPDAGTRDVAVVAGG